MAKKHNNISEGLFAAFAQRLLAITEGCRHDMHEPDESGLKHVSFIGDHLDNAMGENIDADRIAKGYQEYVLILEREPDGDELRQREAFNLATLIAFARIGARQIIEQGKV